jgi:hypothetical protein
MISTKKCLICKGGHKNDCLYWHLDKESGQIWTWCQGKCQRGYSLQQYCSISGISIKEFLQGDFNFIESKPNEVNRIDFPKHFVPLFSKEAQPGLDYLASRNILPDDNLWYDTQRRGIVFPYYYESMFCGAQIRFIEPWIDADGETRKIDTIPGTRLGLLIYNYNQGPFATPIKGLIVTEGAFNCLSLQQALHKKYGSILDNPWKVVALSGSGGSEHHIEVLKELKAAGIKIVLAADTDDAGIKFVQKMIKAEAITHYTFSKETDVDWNDVLIRDGQDELLKVFFQNMVKI